MKNSIPNVRKISDYDNSSNDIDDAWKDVSAAFSMVYTLDVITPKAIPRSGKAMTKAIYELIEALQVYSSKRER